MKNRREAIGMAEVMGAFFLAGSSIVAGKILSAGIPVFTIGFLSLAAALAFLIPMQLRRMGELKRIRGRDLLYMLLQALCGIVLTRVFTLLGLKYTGAVSAGLINSTAPAVMTIFSVLLLGEKLNRSKISGLILVLSGMAIFVFSGGEQAVGQTSFYGNLLIFGAVLAEVAMSLFRMKSSEDISSLTNTTVLFSISLLLFLPPAVVEWKTFPLSAITPFEWTVLIYYGLFGSALAYILWGSGVMKIPGSGTGTALSMIPLSSIGLSVLILGEPFTFIHFAGMILCISGMILCSRVAHDSQFHYDVLNE